MPNASAGEGWDDADTMEQGDSRIYNETPNIILTDYKQQPGEVHNEPTNRHGNRTRERDVQDVQKGNSNWDPTQPDEARRVEDTQLSP
jgi:hypothetical protein